jgi:acetyl-CoA synthetase
MTRTPSWTPLHEEAARDRDAYWVSQAETLPWLSGWDSVFERDGASFRWFVGAETNLARNCLDVHVEGGRGDHLALLYVNERGDRHDLTYAQLLTLVERAAAALRASGVGRGDRVTLYLPVSVEAIALMLACVRIGAIHCVVFAGFGPGALGERIEASGSKLVVCADVAYRKGQEIPLVPIVEEACRGRECVAEIVVLDRAGHTWVEFLARGEGGNGSFVPLEANAPAFILATSGTTAKPKLAIHTQGGYQVGIAAGGKVCFGMTPDDVWWSTSDIGWVVGHSYIVYAPLLLGCTTIAFEGALDYPGSERFWALAAELEVTGLFTSPTAVRLLMRYGADAARGADLSRLERVVCAGEPLNAPAWRWLQHEVLGDRVPVIDHWWQTETGGPVIGNPYGVRLLEIKPGSAGVPLPGMEVAVVDLDGRELPAGEKGILVIRRPFPSLTPTLWGEPDRYASDYWQRVEGSYFTGDSAHLDEDGYVWFAGRADEVMNIAAHRIGTIEVETALLKHPAVAEAGTTGRPDELRGEVIAAFVALRQGHEPSDELREELRQTVRRELGAVAVIGEINFVSLLPKTRSGKIMRRVLKAVVLDQDPGDITTIEDEGSVDEARHAWEEMRASRVV